MANVTVCDRCGHRAAKKLDDRDLCAGCFDLWQKIVERFWSGYAFNDLKPSTDEIMRSLPRVEFPSKRRYRWGDNVNDVSEEFLRNG